MEWIRVLLLLLVLLQIGALRVDCQELDSSLIVVRARSPRTPKTLEYVQRALAWLPDLLKERLLNAGISVTLTPTAKELDGEDGADRFEPRNHRVVICELHLGSSHVNPRTPITTLHEIGHAYDFVLDHYSRTREFMDCYRREAPLVPEQDKAILKHFLQPGRRGPSECFASLLAARYFPGQDRRLNALKADFPETFRLVQSLRD